MSQLSVAGYRVRRRLLKGKLPTEVDLAQVPEGELAAIVSWYRQHQQDRLLREIGPGLARMQAAGARARPAPGGTVSDEEPDVHESARRLRPAARSWLYHGRTTSRARQGLQDAAPPGRWSARGRRRVVRGRWRRCGVVLVRARTVLVAWGGELCAQHGDGLLFKVEHPAQLRPFLFGTLHPFSQPHHLVA